MPFKNDLVLKSYGDNTWQLVSELTYEARDENFILSPGFITDFATVPAPLTWLIPTYGRYTKAAVVHDYLCDCLNSRMDDPPANGRDVDGIFRRIMEELGVPFPRRWLMWCGVRWGALFNPARRAGWYKDLPIVLLISVISLPIMAPVSILVYLGQLVDKALEKLCWS